MGLSTNYRYAADRDGYIELFSDNGSLKTVIEQLKDTKLAKD